MKIFLRLLAFAKPYRHYVPEYFVFTLFSILFGVVNFTLLVPLLQVLFNEAPASTITSLPAFSFSISYFKDFFNYNFQHVVNVYGKMAALSFVCAIIVCSNLLSNTFRYLALRVMTRMRVNVVQKIRFTIYEKLSTLPLSFFHKNKKGDLLSIISTDVQEIESSVVSSFQVVFRDPFMIIAYFFVLFYYSPTLTGFTLLFFPISGIIITTISRRLRKKANESQKMLGSLLSISEETISGTRIIKGFNAEGFVQKRFDKENSFFSRLTKSIINQRELASPISEFLGVLVIVGVILYGGSLVLNNSGGLTAPQFIAYIVFYSQILAPAKNISSAITTIQKGLAAGERVLNIIDTEDNIKEAPVPVTLPSFNSKISIRNVSFSYIDRPVLRNINLDIQKGKIVALVGQSGSGKSTMTDLLPRFYDIQQGDILIDDIPLKNIGIKSLRHLFGMVSQEPILFNDTVFNNIAFGIENATEEAVMQAAKVANAHDFIMRMDNGYQTFIGDRGSKLSGGEKQRLTIARAVFKNPPIMILDEATSSLDTESEKVVQEALYNLMKNRTSIVIAHRLSTIQHADEIIVMKDGEIVERGNHTTLMGKDGHYKRLVEMQMF